jgi:oxaloacetate decarboxylase alpha subunit
VPALGTLLKSLRLLGLGTPASEQALHAVGEADRLLAELADRHGFAPGSAWVFDLVAYVHHVPGDVAAQFMRRLPRAGLSASVARVRQPSARACAARWVRRAMLAPFARRSPNSLLHLQGMARYAEFDPACDALCRQVHGATGLLRVRCPPGAKRRRATRYADARRRLR